MQLSKPFTLLFSGNASTVAEVQNLNFSNQGLSDRDLVEAEKLFDDLVALDDLDLSSNQIRQMPKLNLAECRVLNLANNFLENLDFLEGLWTIEELDLRGNSLIDTVERMKARVFLPGLKILDGEELPEKDAFISIKGQLTNRIEKLYNDSFREKLKNLVESGASGTEYSNEFNKFIERFVDINKIEK